MPGIYFIILLVLSISLNSIFAIRILLIPYTYFGFIFIFLGVILVIWSAVVFKRYETTIIHHRTPVQLITSGSFLISRNPRYLGFSAILFGTAVIQGNLISLIFPIFFVILTQSIFIPDEEKKLGKNFWKKIPCL